MTNEKAAAILNNLIDQLDVERATHSDDQLFLQPDVLIALHKAILLLQSDVSTPATYKKERHSRVDERLKDKNLLPNRGKPWTITDDELLETLFCDNAPLHYICEKLGRTPNGVLSRMVRLGFIADRNDYPDADNRNAAAKRI